jgi:Lamin Tail Domain
MPRAHEQGDNPVRPIRLISLLILVAGTLAGGIAQASAASHPVRFVSIQADPPGTDDKSNASLNAEFIVLKNFSSKAVGMGRYGFEVSESNLEYDFPKGFTLQPGSKVTVHTGKGTNGRHDVYWGRSGYAYPNKPQYFITLWGLGGTQNGQPVSELEDQCSVLGPGSVNQAC